ncbi:AraC family transcriptional regulator [Pseudomonas fluorescens]|uniref:AraC family transcriptional regulator n=1 Tax=Pseudomonas fluorescens TaxID=294 RepID=A0A944HBJ1_PSEFL|nr:helix-turn-helix domain-containing protein [Pseudomonas fluorescens]MBT2297458.1 AraC family transcriptional regulator [Pseudomonas fluorescens]MBT2305656.1 AraC family transcriptional regulator [Pseudomonas fluorescens]MBT2314321.1 AraC family transcriptional regulator [Pseudomonas fluorescens]MBT2319187.1 AraC family transcriptional regulator [Pseudomonas fluorescens]MBT2328540.1 AraC family transcriptional regulator [Pseudomonas fluorescens]
MAKLCAPTPRHHTAYEQPWFVLNSSRYSVMPSEHPAISHFYAFDVALSSDILAVPDGCVDIVFDCDATRPTARICGTPLAAQAVVLHQGHHYFGVRFSPGIIPGFINVLAEELTEQELDLLEVSGFAQRIFERIVQTPLLAEQMRLFNDHLAPRLMGKTSQLTSMVIQQALRHRGDIRIQHLEDLSGYTSRTLHRQFSQDTGLSPKTFCRIIRCQAALETLNTHQDVSFSELALDLGFSDQSHFLRDFKKLVSTTPYDYQRKIVQNAYADRISFA